jgi:hypothetical protein
MKGILTRDEYGIWMVKWSDIHPSFGIGIDWIFQELHPESNTIRYVKDNQILIKPLEEGLSVEFEYVKDEPDKPYLYPKLIFPEVDIFEKEEYIKEYIKEGGILWSIKDVDAIRDGGTLVLVRTKQDKLTPLYIHKDNWTIHSGYPTTDKNLILNKSEKVYIFDRLEKYKKDCEFNLTRSENIIKKIKL